GRRIVTIEDPVENKLPGVVQIAVKPEIGLTFAQGLRSVLRGDPNVIMVGEMRDLETAEIAIRSALTGHLVFSTLHTNDAISGVTRLVDMGVEPFLVSSSVRAFVAQRLVRRLCPDCRESRPGDPESLRRLGITVTSETRMFAPKGCSSCRGIGYRGRLAIFEICVVTPELQELIARGAGAAELKQQANKDGFVSMRNYGLEKALGGETTIEEVLSATLMESASTASLIPTATPVIAG
ncbi:MAG: Flp pilus assembly complex ATPase component TadA, partial [Verrucomicrobiales bacterium]|nr:Flp pilus assembly complex ATPase component TadA [Verrucomicrobiales bacterium]